MALLLGCGSSPKPAASQFPQVPGLEQRQVQFHQVVYPFYVFVPFSLNSAHPAPAVLLIHGGGGNGPDIIAAWKNFASKWDHPGKILRIKRAKSTTFPVIGMYLNTKAKHERFHNK